MTSFWTKRFPQIFFFKECWY